MDEFDASWLQLREPYDHAARDEDALAFVAPRLGDVVRILDLGSGSGSNLRYLAPRLKGHQHWRLADNDTHLLTIAQKSTGDYPNVGDLAVQRINLAEDLSSLTFETVDLITASAFIDLVSAEWIESFVAKAAAVKVPALLFTLNVDGRVDWTPHDPFDNVAASLFAQHMQNDKGFGQALGYQGWERLAEQLANAGFQVRTLESPWRLEPKDAEIQLALLDGYAAAAIETDLSKKDAIMSWKTRRAAFITDGQSALTVGHKDVCAVL
jgi:SAM-dependent methyltransferase